MERKFENFRQIMTRDSLAAALCSLFLVSCSESASVKPKPEGANASPRPTSSIDDNDNEPSRQLGAPSSNPSASLDAIFRKCGVDQQTMNDPNAVLMERTLKGIPKVFTGSQSFILININYKVTIMPSLRIRSTPSGSTVATEIQVDAQPSLAKGPAEQKVADQRGTSTSKGFSIDERTRLTSENPDWNGVTCTVQPSSVVEGNRGSNLYSVKYTPALPSGISPKALPEAYAEELGNGRVFRNITAEVMTGGVAGQRVNGTVTVTRVNPTLVLQDATGRSANIQADVAYQFKFDFGVPQQMLAMGITPMQTFYIDHASKEFRAIVADSGDPTAGQVVFVNESLVAN